MADDAQVERFPRRTLRRQQTRARILAAATSQFRAVGYGAATMQAIADEADVHVTTLFTHFKTKSDIAISLTDVSIELLEKFISGAKGVVPFLDFFRTIVIATAKEIRTETEPEMSLWHQLRKDPELAFAWAAYEQTQIELFAKYIAEDYDLSLKTDYRPMLVATTLVSSTLLSHRRWSEASRSLNLEKETLKALELAETMARSVLPASAKKPARR